MKNLFMSILFSIGIILIFISYNLMNNTISEIRDSQEELYKRQKELTIHIGSFYDSIIKLYDGIKMHLEYQHGIEVK